MTVEQLSRAIVAHFALGLEPPAELIEEFNRAVERRRRKRRPHLGCAGSAEPSSPVSSSETTTRGRACPTPSPLRTTFRCF
jgi:hypothetical protein